MDWINLWGLLFMAILMIPNVIFAVKCKDGFKNKVDNKALNIFEQIGRVGCFIFMILINLPGAAIGFRSDEAFALYLMVDAALVVTYCIIWVVCFRKNNLFRALSLSIIPSVLFLFSGIMSHSLLLIISALIFAPCHIYISCKNAE